MPPVDERMIAGRGGSVTAPVPIRLLIDTGAKRTTLIPGIVDHFQPTSGAEAHLVTPVGSVMIDLVWVCLEFPEAGLASFSEILVARHPMPPLLAQFRGLLGRDLLARMHSFEYRGRRGRYTLRDTPGWFDWLRRWL
ncbi:MAG TPA: hypothetical protein VKA46_32130 [Gemmataceae bacterium]|nr:hypothetical protein [Gemmataceae bacterium]